MLLFVALLGRKKSMMQRAGMQYEKGTASSLYLYGLRTQKDVRIATFMDKYTISG